MTRLKRLVPAPLRAFRWRYQVLCKQGARRDWGRVMRIFAWTMWELKSPTILFSTPDGTRFRTMTGNYSALRVYLDDYRDPPIQAFMERHLPPGSVFVDVGANIGTYAIRASQRVGSSGKVIALEASPYIFKFLVENIGLNNCHNVHPLNLAAGAERGLVRLNFVSSNPGQSHVSTSEIGVDIHQESLDALLDGMGIKGVDYVKVDVEGFEMAVLQGAERTIAANPRIVIQMEVIDEHLRRYGHSAADLTQLALSFGLRPHRVMADGRAESVEPADVLRGGDILWSQSIRPD